MLSVPSCHRKPGVLKQTSRDGSHTREKPDQTFEPTILLAVRSNVYPVEAISEQKYLVV